MHYKSEKTEITDVMLADCMEKYKNKYEYALVYRISEIILCRAAQLDLSQWDECLEARFFSERGEAHFFDYDGKKVMAEIVDEEEGEGDIQIKKYKIAPRFQEAGKVLCVQEYLSYDEDGQIFTELTRLKGIE
jgi:hypothetical protein